jgi:hypothetical protein
VNEEALAHCGLLRQKNIILNYFIETRLGLKICECQFFGPLNKAALAFSQVIPLGRFGVC